MKINIWKVDPNPQQPRKEFDQEALGELCNSIRENGLIQPVTVEKHADRYTLVAGERRLRACKLLGYQTIEAYVTEPSNHNGQQLLLSAIVENLQRENINPIDEAEAIKKLKDEYSMSVYEIAQALGKHETQVYQKLALLEYDPEIIELVKDGKLTKNQGLCFAIRSIPEKEARLQMANMIIDRQMPIRTAVKAAYKVARVMKEKSDLKKAESPAVLLAATRNDFDYLDEKTPPPDWDIKVLAGSFSDWPAMHKAAVQTCDKCLLRSVASVETCSECPLSEFLISVVKK